MKFNLISRFMTLLVCFLFVNCAHALDFNEKKTVRYSGVSFLGDYSSLTKSYPVAFDLNKRTVERQSGQLDKTLDEHIIKNPPEYLELKKELGVLNSDSHLAVTFAIENELVSHEQVGDVYKVIGEVSGQLVFFDFSTMSLIENYPVSMAKNHVVNLSKNVKSEGEKILADVYLGTHDHESILNLAAKILSEIKINESTGVRFQVKNIKISENVINTLNKKTNIDKLRKYVGYFFSSRLKNKYDVVVLPFLKDYSVSNTMSGRFSNGDIYNLKVPEPDYSFNISIKKIKKKQFKNSNMIYACQIHFTMEDTFQNSKYIDGYYHYSVPKLLLDNQENTDDTSAYIDAIESLLDELVIQLAKPNKKWLKLHGGNNTSYDQFNAKRRLFHEK